MAPTDIVERLRIYRDEDGVASSAALDGACEIERLRGLCRSAALVIKNRQAAEAMMNTQALIERLEEAGKGEIPTAGIGLHDFPILDRLATARAGDTGFVISWATAAEQRFPAIVEKADETTLTVKFGQRDANGGFVLSKSAVLQFSRATGQPAHGKQPPRYQLVLEG